MKSEILKQRILDRLGRLGITPRRASTDSELHPDTLGKFLTTNARGMNATTQAKLCKGLRVDPKFFTDKNYQESLETPAFAEKQAPYELATQVPFVVMVNIHDAPGIHEGGVAWFASDNGVVQGQVVAAPKAPKIKDEV